MSIRRSAASITDGIVFDHHQRIARVAQPVHGFDDAVQIARMQADARLVEHEQRVDERRAERRRQVDPLHFAARQRAALPVERQIAEADVAQILEARAHFGEQQLERVVEQGARQAELVEEAPDALDRHQHQVVHASGPATLRAARASSRRRAAGSACRPAARRPLAPCVPRRHSSDSVFRRAPPQVSHGV